MNMGSYSCCTPSASEYKRIVPAVEVLKVVAEANRLKLLCILRQGRHCVCELEEHTGLSQSLISHHLQDLKTAALVTDKKKGLRVYYSLTANGRRITDSVLSL